MLIAILLVAAVATFVTFAVINRGVNKERAHVLANAESVLDETFSGPVATYSVGMSSLPVGRVVEGAAARGYRLTSQSGETVKTLTFERV